MATVVGRDRELEAIGAFLDFEPTRAPARVLLVQGEPGIGKTTLWQAGVDLGTARGYRVLSCAAADAEAQLAFTSLRDLLANVFDEVAADLPEPQRHALDVALLREAPSGRPPGRGAVAVGFLSALRALATRGRILVAVDDIQWIDSESATVLLYALRRLSGADATILLAQRAGEADPLELARLDRAQFQALEIGGLSVGALGRILHERLDKSFARPTLLRIHEVSGGNAFYALEVTRSLGETAASLLPGAPLPVPDNLLGLVENRVATLPGATFDALAIAAALSRPTVGVIAAALAADAGAVLEPALDARVIEVDGDVVRFAHPLFAAAVYGLAALRRPALHARLAEVVTDPEERGRHLALATAQPNEALAELVEDGARAAYARGSPAAAADLLAHALRLTPAKEAEARRRRSVAEVDYRFESGDTERASTLLDGLLSDEPPGPNRARLLSRQARVHHFARDMPASLTLLYQALEEAGDDTAARADIEEGLAWRLLLTRTDAVAAATHARSAAALAQSSAEPAMFAEALAVHALAEFVLGRQWRETMSRAISLEDATEQLRVLRHPSLAYAYCLSASDDLDHARDVFQELLRRSQSSGDESSMAVILNHLAEVECHAGRWLDSTAYADDGLMRTQESRHQATQSSILGKKALVAARRGDIDGARECAWQALTSAGGADFDPTEPGRAIARGGEAALWALGFVELLLGNAGEADRYLGSLTRTLLEAGIREPGEIRCLPDEIDALSALGRRDEAEALLEELESWADRLERPSVQCIANRCRGVLLAARDDAEAALSAFEEAAAIQPDLPLPFERGRTLLALGTQQRRMRQRRAARTTLEGALTIFEELGAMLMAEKTRAELARIGGRAPSSHDLTPTERRIASLVAEGKKNKEVAAALVISVHTVEAALTQIYRKLEIRSRTELAHQFSQQD